MATYNWQPNPYFTTNRYKAPTGSDTTGDGTANKPYRTIQKCIDSGGSFIQCAPEVIREQWTGSPSLYFENGCIIDHFSGGELRGSILGGKAINSRLSNFVVVVKNIFIKGVVASPSFSSTQRTGVMLKNTGIASIGLTQGSYSPYDNSTIIGHLLTMSSSTVVSYPNGLNRCILASCDVVVPFNLSTSANAFDFNLFHNCRYKFGNDSVFLSQVQLETTYGVTGIDAVKAYHQAKFGTSDAFNYSKVADPLFNNPDYDDYTLQTLSPARHMSYDGTFVGAKDIAFPTFAYADDLGHPNALYNASKNANTLVANNSITLVRNPDGSAVGNGAITEKPKDMGKIYELKTNQSSYIFADRNREMLDVNADINLNAPISAGTPLISGTVYVSEGGSSVYNGVTYPNRSRITAVDSVQSFTTAEGAVYYAIREYPNRYTNYIRYKQTVPGTQIPAGTDVLTAGSWYRVFGNSITWDAKGIPVGDSFQAVAGKLSFTGSGVVVEEFSEADVYSEIIIDAPIKCRRVGNVITGAIDAGTDGKPLTNGHKEYYNATNKPRAEFSIFARYIQKDWILNTGMLK